MKLYHLFQLTANPKADALCLMNDTAGGNKTTEKSKRTRCSYIYILTTRHRTAL